MSIFHCFPSENLELNGRDAGLFEGDMRLTIDQALMMESGGGDVRGSITTGKWPGAVLAYEIESSLSKLFRTQEIISLGLITSEFNKLMLPFSQYDKIYIKIINIGYLGHRFESSCGPKNFKSYKKQLS